MIFGGPLTRPGLLLGGLAWRQAIGVLGLVGFDAILFQSCAKAVTAIGRWCTSVAQGRWGLVLIVVFCGSLGTPNRYFTFTNAYNQKNLNINAC